MIETVYEPLTRYRDEYKEAFANHTREAFAALLATSGVDPSENARLMGEIARLGARLQSQSGSKGRWGCLNTLLIIALVGGLIYAGVLFLDTGGLLEDWNPERGLNAILALVGSVVTFILFRKVGLPGYRRVCRAIADLTRARDEKIGEAKEQMSPLNRLYEWDLTTRLIEQTVPRLQFDPFFSEERLAELVNAFGWNNGFNDDKSILFAQSGEINGNPFVFSEARIQGWGTKTYKGELTIHWTEEVEDEEGHVHTVHRSQTLTAEVDKPIPEYTTQRLLIYGNDAAPNLVFTRTPSNLSSPDTGLFASMRKKKAIKKLRNFSRNLDDESQYTMMANEEFEALFNTVDRNDEVEFRLLFTALAQRQMLDLVKDRTIGFGDDFAFLKSRKINIIQAKHLDGFPLTTDPSRFYDYNLKRAEQNFQSLNEAYFKHVYFAFAPLLSIPLYQHIRSHRTIYEGVIPRASFWEHESVANYYGDDRFKHPDCVTKTILKTAVESRRDGMTDLTVTAYGFRGESRVDYVRVWGGDGCPHDVPVEWVEYLPVERTSRLSVSEQKGVSYADYRKALAESTPDAWRQMFRAWSADPTRASFRRSIVSW
ncbi:MAG: hypothetical protein J6334_05745 [Kiritimatiellae bacterium]|nr:hypothetical protein [Kiritimatiellia bacterium]